LAINCGVRPQELAQFRSDGIDGRDVAVPDEERALDVAGLLPGEVGDRLDAQRTLRRSEDDLDRQKSTKTGL
jgi:hypothetical protein